MHKFLAVFCIGFKPSCFVEPSQRTEKLKRVKVGCLHSHLKTHLDRSQKLILSCPNKSHQLILLDKCWIGNNRLTNIYEYAEESVPSK